MASDGIWDALSNEAAAESCRGLPAELAAKLVVKVTLHVVNSLQYLDSPCLSA
jgi:serine/threonine protein phosphatase PrpC